MFGAVPAKPRPGCSETGQRLQVRQHALLGGAPPRRKEGVAEVSAPPTRKVAPVVRVTTAGLRHLIAIVHERRAADRKQQGECELETFAVAPFSFMNRSTSCKPKNVTSDVGSLYNLVVRERLCHGANG